MKIFICILVGYLIGSLSPAALISKLKNKDPRKNESGNLGATNTALMFGRMFGFLVMILDILKGFLAVKIAIWIVPEAEWLGMLAGFAAVLGHCFPFYLNFNGGKGLATFGGVILAYHLLFFLLVLTTGVIIVLVANSGTILSYYAAVSFPIFVAATSKSVATIVICIIMSLLMMVIFLPDLKKAIKGQGHTSRDFLKKWK